MQVRLAFSIAIRAKSDILLLDEVLAVGDEAFQRKCLDVFEEYKKRKQTVILVTHDMETVRRFCTRAMLVNAGQIEAIGNPIKVANAYRKLNQEDIGGQLEKDNKTQQTNLKIRLLDEDGKSKTTFKTGDTLITEVSWPPNPLIKNAGVAIMKNTGEFVFGSNTVKGDTKPKDNKISYKVRLNLGADKFHIMAGTFGETDHDVIDFVVEGPSFVVRRDVADTNLGLADLDYSWVNKG